MRATQLFSLDSFEELKLDHVHAFLREAGDESALWEAKGADDDGLGLRPQHVTKSVCAFANQFGGVLLLGASKRGEDWGVTGFQPPGDDVDLWLNQAIESLRPIPATATKVFSLEEGRVVAVIDTAALSETPCMTSAGEIFERVSGKSERVVEPLRLAALVERGRDARERSEVLALRSSKAIFDSPGLGVASCAWISFGMAATSYEADIGSRLFTNRFKEEMRVRFVDRLFNSVDQSSFLGGIQWTAQQEFLELSNVTPSYTWRVRSNWDGAVGAVVALDRQTIRDFNYMHYAVGPAQRLLSDLVALLGGQADSHFAMRMRLAETSDDRDAMLDSGNVNLENMPPDSALNSLPERQLLAQRWGRLDDYSKSELQSISREILRATGVFVLDDDDEPFVH